MPSPGWSACRNPGFLGHEGRHVNSCAVSADADDATRRSEGEREPQGPAGRTPRVSPGAGGRLAARTVPVADPGDLLAALPDPGALAWVRRGAGLVAWGQAARITLPAGEDRFTAAGKWLHDLFDGAEADDQVRRPGTGLVAFGSFTFDPASEGSVLVVPSVVLGRSPGGRSWLTTISGGSAVSASGSPPAGCGSGALPPSPAEPAPPAGLRWHDGSMSAPQWEQAVAAAVERIRSGGLRKVVLARDLHATAADPIDARVPLRRLAARYPDCFTFACDRLIGATPELLVRRRGREVSALILAGTAPRGARAAEDARLGAGLLASAKNTEEHAYAVASVREALGPLCGTLDIAPRPSLLKLANAYHLGTRVRGRLRAGRSALDLAAALHPTAAVCGTPAEAAMELIRELETMERGRYAGPVGWVDARGNGEWGIALRCAELDGRRARLFAGCGIVADSDPPAELAETQVKFAPVRHALEG
jgi:menaquinone-specific isochorismate synthase